MKKSRELDIPIQINGKARGRMTVPAECSKQDLEEQALSDARTRELIADKIIVKTIVVPGRLVNIVVK